MSLKVAEVMPGGIADQCGIRPGDRLKRINGEEVLDQIDYQFLSAKEKLLIEVGNQEGLYELYLEKDEMEPLGLTFLSSLGVKPYACANHCVFCFIGQMPPGMRPSLYVRDDDWRLSLMMGNYITLSNLSEKEFQRIAGRRATPLHISVHTTDGATRAKMMGNPKAGPILEQLKRLKSNGICFHCQIVLCPGVNDGTILDRTLEDLASLFPAALSIALVPVGLTRYREGLTPIKAYTKRSATELLEKTHQWQREFLQKWDTRLVFASDEFYGLAEAPIPPADAYEQYPQIENGVGLLRRFFEEYSLAYQGLDAGETGMGNGGTLLSFQEKRKKQREASLGEGARVPRRVVVATGVLAAPYLTRLLLEKPVDGVSVDILPVANRFFGETVTVAGLVTGRDLLGALQSVQADEILIPDCMVRHEGYVFLDDMPLSALESGLSVPIRVVDMDGAAFLEALQGEQFASDA